MNDNYYLKKEEKIEYPSGNFAANQSSIPFTTLLSLLSSQKISPKEYVPYEIKYLSQQDM